VRHLLLGYAFATAVVAANRLARFEPAVVEAFETRDAAVTTAFSALARDVQRALDVLERRMTFRVKLS
jgi:hypothetical protein